MGTLVHTEWPRSHDTLAAASVAESRFTATTWSPNSLPSSADDNSRPRRQQPTPARTQSHSKGARLHKRVVTAPALSADTADSASTADAVSEHLDPTVSDARLASNQELSSLQRYPGSNKTRSDHLRKNLRRLTQPKEARSASAELREDIDLSRTAAENEERTGLSIASPTARSADSPVLGHTPASPALPPSAQHHMRSSSHNSNSSSTMPSSFKPTVPWVHPIHHQPSSRPTMPHSHSTSFNSDQSADIVNRPRGESTASAFTARTHDTSDSSSYRPALKLNTSTHSSVLGSGSATPTIRSRRGTNMSNMSRPDFPSPDFASPSARNSFDRAFNFIRRDTDPLDPATRAASIQAARQAFEDREEAKARKFERQERRAAERREQAAVKVEERRRRKSDALEKRQAIEAERKRRKSDAAPARSRLVEATFDDKDGEPGDTTQHFDMEVPRIKARGARGQAKAAPAAGGRTKRRPAAISADDVQFPHVSRKRAAKSTYLRFWTWFKTRLLRLGLAHGRS